MSLFGVFFRDGGGARLSLIALAFVACTAPPRSQAAAPSKSVPAAVVRTSAGAARPATDHGPFPRVEMPLAVACRFREPSLWIDVVLGFDVDAPYAKLGLGPRLEVDFPVSSSTTTVGVRAATQGVQLEGIARADQFPLHPARAFIVDEIFVPAPDAALVARSALAGELDVELGLEGVVRATNRSWSSRARLHFSRPCSHFALSNGDFDPRDALGGKGLAEERVMKAGRLVALSAEARGPKVAELLPSEEWRAVDLLAEQSGRSRIAWPVGDVVITGWIQSSELFPVHFWCRNGDDVRLIRRAVVPPFEGSFACDHEVDLIAELRGERRTVGRIGRGTRMVERAVRDELLSIELPDEGITPVAGAELLVTRDAARRCRKL